MEEEGKSKDEAVRELPELRLRIKELDALQHEHLRVKKELNASGERYRTILESIEEAYLELDLQGKPDLL